MTGKDFHAEWRGEWVKGWADGVDRAHLRKLRRGEVEPSDELDLYGLTRAEAEQLVGSAIEEAYREGVRCLSVIHGRGATQPKRSGIEDGVHRMVEPRETLEPGAGIPFGSPRAGRGRSDLGPAAKRPLQTDRLIRSEDSAPDSFASSTVCCRSGGLLSSSTP
jgi:hypothetical protein